LAQDSPWWEQETSPAADFVQIGLRSHSWLKGDASCYQSDHQLEKAIFVVGGVKLMALDHIHM